MIVHNYLTTISNIDFVIRHNQPEKYIILTSVFIIVIFLIVLKIYYKVLISDVIQNAANQTFKPGNLKDTSRYKKETILPEILLLAIFFISITGIIFSILHYVAPRQSFLVFENVFLLFFLILLAVITYVIIKTAGIVMLGWLFRSQAVAQDYLNTMFSLFYAAGIIITPFLLLMPFVTDTFSLVLATTAFLIIGISFLFRIIKGFLISFQIKFSFHYTILYFCGMEILPLLIMVEFSSKYFN